MRSRRKKQEGFTLIEIMVVILILGLLTTLIVLRLPGATDRHKRTKAVADITVLKAALNRYYIDIGSYPTTDQGLQALVTPHSQYREGGFIDRIPPDPWGNPYVYQSDGNSYTLRSTGGNGAEGGTGKNPDIDASQF